MSQGFTTGLDELGYRLQGIGVNIEGSQGRIPALGPTSVSVAVHADSSGKPGAKLFDLVSPTEFAAGHSFFEAPPGTVLAPNTSYVLVWSYNDGTLAQVAGPRATARTRALDQAPASQTRSIGAPT